jgi:acetyl-CoA synthetase
MSDKKDMIVKGSFKGNMENYEEKYKTFNWRDIEKEFSWYQSDKLNIAYEAIDRHTENWRKNKIAMYFEGEDKKEKYTFQEMKQLTDKFGNVLKNLGVKKGDRVFGFLSRTPAQYVSILGTNKIGGIYGPLFGGFRGEAIKDRLLDSGAKVLITQSSLKSCVDQVRDYLPELQYVIFIDAKTVDKEKGELIFDEEMKKASEKLEIEWLDRETPHLLHYTSGTTGKPKGVVHVHYAMVGQYQTAKWVLDLRDDDTYFCTADPGWVTGTSYGIYGPWLNGISQVIYAGRFDAEEWYSIIERYKVTVWYTAPTALRMLMAAGEKIIKERDLSSLRHICSVGEPLNAEVIRWGIRPDVYHLPIHDTWWMTETGQQLIANYPCLPIKPGSMGKPFPGIRAGILDAKGKEVSPNVIGNLVIKPPWPSMMRDIWRGEWKEYMEGKYKEYFKYEGWFSTGDSAYKDEDGYFWFQGRIDDIIKTSGERVGPFEVESVLVEHTAVAAAGVIGKPDPIRGNIIKAFVQLREDYKPSEELKRDLSTFVKNRLAAHAYPREIEFRDKLPITRSGKIMRRVLKAWELGLPTGDLSTLED